MSDFWLATGKHGCEFLAGVGDLVASKVGGEGYWRITNHGGTKWPTGDRFEIEVDPISGKCTVKHFEKMVQLDSFEIIAGVPTFPNAKNNFHYGVGKDRFGHEIYFYKFNIPTLPGVMAILIQGFDPTGGYWEHRPLKDTIVLYEDPKIMFLSLRGEGDEKAIDGTRVEFEEAQDDEGSGIEPP